MNTPPRPTVVRAYHSPIVEDLDLGIQEIPAKTRGEGLVWNTVINITFNDSKEHVFPFTPLFSLDRSHKCPGDKDFKSVFWAPFIEDIRVRVKDDSSNSGLANICRALINSKHDYTNKPAGFIKKYYSSKSPQCPHKFAVISDTEYIRDSLHS